MNSSDSSFVRVISFLILFWSVERFDILPMSKVSEDSLRAEEHSEVTHSGKEGGHILACRINDLETKKIEHEDSLKDNKES